MDVTHVRLVADRAVAAAPQADPFAAELEAALAMRRAGAAPKAIRRALRQIEELLSTSPRTLT